MDALEFAEKRAEETLKYLRSSYDDLHGRVQKLVTALVGGSGAVGAYALGKASNPGEYVQTVSLAVLAAVWFLIAAAVAIRGARSRNLSPGSGPGKIWDYYIARLAELPETDKDRAANALSTTRKAELDLQQQRVSEYIKACSDRAIALDYAYIAVAVSPVVPLIAFTILHFVIR